MEWHKHFSLIGLRRHYKQPHTLYHELRKTDSIYFDTFNHCWLVTGLQAVKFLLTHEDLSSRLTESSETQLFPIDRQILFMEGIEHKKAQQLIVRSLARLIKRIPEEMQQFTQALVARQADAGELDVVQQFAAPLSLFVIAHVLGMPADTEDQLAHLVKGSDLFSDLTSGYFRGGEDEQQGLRYLEEYFRTLIASKKASGGDDVVSEFLSARDIFPREEDLIANCMMVFAAGRVTMQKLLGNSMALLLPHWQDYQRAYHIHPHQTIKNLTEELLRVITPTRYVVRQALKDIDLSKHFPGKHSIKQGEKIFLFLEAANFDPDVFPTPNQFTSARMPNPHVTFGYGRHQCPGAMLARLEIHGALEALLSLSHPQPKAGATPIWNPNPNLGGYTSYPIVFARPQTHFKLW